MGRRQKLPPIFVKTAILMILILSKHHRKLVLTSSILISCWLISKIHYNLFTLTHTFIHAAEGFVYIDGKAVDMNKYQLFLKMIGMSQALCLVVLALVCYGFFQVIKKQKLGLVILNLLLAGVILANICTVYNPKVRAGFPFLMALPELVVGALLFWLNILLLKNVQGVSNSNQNIE